MPAVLADPATEIKTTAGSPKPERPSYVPPGEFDSMEAMLAWEKAEVASNRANRNCENLTGIALSGGGIRSAIFCLGALQALAANKVLANFDYMSSVSGGGYIASALQWFWQNPKSGAQSDDFPFDVEKLQRSDLDENRNLAYLRTHGRYLTPGDGLSIWSLTAVVIRTIFLNLAVWIPLGAIVFFGLIVGCRYAPDWLKNATPNFLSFVMVAEWQGHAGHSWPLELFFAFCAAAGLTTLVFYSIWALAFSLDTRISPKQANDANWIAKIVAIGVLLVVIATAGFAFVHVKVSDSPPWLVNILICAATFGVLLAFLAILQLRGSQDSASYRWRRTFERWAGLSLPWITIVFAIGTVPIVPYLFADHHNSYLKAAITFIGGASGVVTGLFGHRAQTQKETPSDTTRWILMAASGFFLYFIAVVAYVLAQLALDPGPMFGDDYQNVVRGVVFAAAVVAAVLAWRTNVNYVGLHRFYRDRIMEAFMPCEDCVKENAVGPSKTADRLSIAELWPPKLASPQSPLRSIPYPIVNTNAILVNDRNRKRAWRGGDNFIISPNYIGSSATGWEVTDRHIAKHGPQSLASAVAASGAALNANAAYVGVGVTRDRLLAIVMMLLNLRLGMWVARPSASRSYFFALEPNHFVPGFWYGMTLGGYSSNSGFQELSDGGHFDNLGIYELIRRRLKTILVIDGEEDGAMAMPALFSVAQRVKEDFDATISLDNCLDPVMPSPPTSPGYPESAEYVTKPYFETSITYRIPDPRSVAPTYVTGKLIYVKLSLASTVGYPAKAYRAQHTDFPHQSTADQFFVPEQVEAYRTIGYCNMDLALAGLKINAASF